MVNVLHVSVPVALLGSGSAMPAHAFRTAELLDQVSPYLSRRARRRAEQIARKLAIYTRFFSRPFASARERPMGPDTAPSLGARALRTASAASGFDATGFGMLIGHTTTPHTLLPSNAAWIAQELDYGGPHMELRQACTGFAIAAAVASSLISTGVESVGIVGSEVGSVMLDLEHLEQDPTQIVNLMQMGDGAGAVIVGPCRSLKQSRLEHFFYGSLTGQHAPAICLPQGGSGSPRVETHGITHFRHDYTAIREHGTALLEAGLNAARNLGIERRMIDWWLPQQVNGRMAEVCARTLGLPPERVIVEAGAVGNVGSAATWIALDRLRRSGRLRAGDRVLVLGAEASKFMYGGFLYTHGDEQAAPA
ncbi:MAG TPA: 3-oxoacyl-[acyl-carrier-protein] synthase III C-terminal domain-containing protein [Steroidobacteraceae bacterium]